MKDILLIRWILLVLFGLSGSTSFSQNQKIKIACIGNSVTYGYGLKNPFTESYPAQLQKMLGDRYEAENFGHNGATLLRKGHNPYFKTKEFSDALKFVPDIAVIHLGLNDTDPRDWPGYGDEFMCDYSWLIDTIRKTNPQVKIYICQLTPIFHDHPRFKSGTRDWFWQIQKLIPEIAKANKTGLIDLHEPLYGFPNLFPDALHPNEEGAKILAKTVYHMISGDFGGLKLASAFSSHMVLQQNKPIKFFGTANAKEKITVSFDGIKFSTIANENGKWEIVFPAKKAGGPYWAKVSSLNSSISVDDILIGEVWLCSGQSNMAFPLRNAINASDEMKEAEKNNTLRLLRMQPLAEPDNVAWDSLTLEKVNELQYFSGNWQRCDSNNAKNFSAVAYYFAKKIQQQLHIPIGLVEVAVGGSTTESWIDRYTMEHDHVFVNELSNWRKSDFFMPWVRERADTNLKKAVNPKQRHPYESCYNYEAGISQFTQFPIAGVIWYQGESNAHNIELHETLFPILVKSWREKWGYDFPFYYVQLSSTNRPSWTAFRFSQLQILKKIPNSGMAISSDLGDSTNVHPRRKKEVGERLARLALHFTYKQKEIIPYGPMPLKAQLIHNRIIVSFQYAENVLKSKDGKPLRGFELRDEKGIKTKAGAYIQNNQVIIPVVIINKPVSVLYGWKPYADANLVNKENLPCSTFKLDIQ